MLVNEAFLDPAAVEAFGARLRTCVGCNGPANPEGGFRCQVRGSTLMMMIIIIIVIIIILIMITPLAAFTCIGLTKRRASVTRRRTRSAMPAWRQRWCQRWRHLSSCISYHHTIYPIPTPLTQQWPWLTLIA
jgi:hypothetical protein